MTMHSVIFLVRWPEQVAHYSQQGKDGQTLVLCLDHRGIVAWRVLDAQYFGVAQARRRVFVCGKCWKKGSIPERYYLSSRLCRRAIKNYYGKKKKIPNPFLIKALKEKLHRYCLEALPKRTGTVIAGYNGTTNQDMTMSGGAHS
ncbi:putative DNA methyltransferase [Escherichia coli]|nr:putative DNA methyltransferase [Escherichia coli]